MSPWDGEGFCFYHMEQLQAVRAGPWKLYLPLDEKRNNLAHKTAPANLASSRVLERNGFRELPPNDGLRQFERRLAP